MVWKCISTSGVDLVKNDGIKTAEMYKQISIHYAIPSQKLLIDNDFLAQKLSKIHCQWNGTKSS